MVTPVKGETYFGRFDLTVGADAIDEQRDAAQPESCDLFSQRQPSHRVVIILRGVEPQPAATAVAASGDPRVPHALTLPLAVLDSHAA